MWILLETMAVESRKAAHPDVLERLLLEIASGSQDALAELYRRTKTAVYALAISYLKNPYDAEDVTQEAFVRIWEHAGGYCPRGTPLAWMMTITRNLALMRIRERGKTQELEPEEWERLAADHPMVTVEDQQVLQAALAILTDAERQIVLLHAVTGLKHREIAVLLDSPISTVLSKYRRALMKLKKKLEGGEPHEGTGD